MLRLWVQTCSRQNMGRGGRTYLFMGVSEFVFKDGFPVRQILHLVGQCSERFNQLLNQLPRVHGSKLRFQRLGLRPLVLQA